jgi:hypothetical protein
MADLLKVSQILAQSEAEHGGLLKVSQILAQSEAEHGGLLKVSQVLAQSEAQHGGLLKVSQVLAQSEAQHAGLLKVSQILAQIEYMGVPDSIVVTPSSPTVGEGQTQQFVATGNGTDITTSCTWTSSNTSCATINASTGLATGLSVGTTTIRATIDSVYYEVPLTISAAARYWVGNSGLWTDSTHWSLTSGGAGGATVPTVLHDVYVDENSFTEPGHHIKVT